jgi:histidine ammonia-lyase
MLVEYVGAGALGDLRAAAGPAAVQSTILSRGSGDTASFASLAARQLLVTADSYELLAAAELLAAVRASRIRGAPNAGVLGEVLAACERLPDDRSDRDLTDDLETARCVLGTLAGFVDLPV